MSQLFLALPGLLNVIMMFESKFMMKWHVIKKKGSPLLWQLCKSMHIPVEFQTEPLIEMFLLKKSYSFSCFCDTFQDKRIPFPLRCTFAFLPYAPRKMFIQQLCNKDHVMRTILSYNRRVPPKNGSKLWFFWGGGGSRLSLGFFYPSLRII